MSYLAINILPNIWIGNIQAAEKESFFEKENITCVLNISKTVPNFFIYDSKVEYIRIPIDKKDLLTNYYKYFPIISEYIYKSTVLQKQNILIHDNEKGEILACIALYTYLIKYYKKTVQDSINITNVQNTNFSCNIDDNIKNILYKWYELNQ